MNRFVKAAAFIAAAQLALVPVASAGKKQEYIKLAEETTAQQFNVGADKVRFKQISTTGGFARVYLKVHTSDSEKKTIFCKIRKKNKNVEFCKEK